MPRVLMLSAYDALSHRNWRMGLAAYLLEHLPDVEIFEAVLPPRFFSWRQRGNSLSFARHPLLQQSYDLVIATSMTDLSALRGLNASLAATPVLVYFHENQFAYPDSHSRGLVERQMTSLYTALSADALFFNTAYNRSTFLAGAGSLLEKMPDEVPPGIIAELDAKSMVLPVALSETPRPNTAGSDGGIRIAWNHRWEHDKGPDALLAIIEMLLIKKVAFKMSLFGQQFSRMPAVFDQLLSTLAENGCLEHAGFVETRDEYLTLLAGHHVVLSTARHEFQGLAVQEAMNCGCLPVTPNGLSYPEYVADRCRYDSIVEAVEIIVAADELRLSEDISLDHYRWEAVGPAWLTAIDELLKT